MTVLSTKRRRRLPGIALIAALTLLPAMASGMGAAGAAAPPPMPTWSFVSPPVAPPPLAYAAMTYDSDNATIVAFGGRRADGSLSSDTWVWNGSAWSQMSSPVPARSGAAMAFDPALHQLILFGGQGPGGQLLSDTWAWNGASWFALTPARSPPARTDAGLAFDANDQLVLFGGTGTLPAVPVPPVGGIPAAPALPGPPAAGTPSVLNDTWVWTGTTWAQQQGVGPLGRTDAALGWDGVRHSTILLGGSTTPAGTTTPAGLLGDTWAWGGGAWTPVATPTTPGPRLGPAVAFDGDLGGLVAFGGSGPAGPDGDTWLWDGQTWQQLNPLGAPAPRVGAAMAFDRAAHQLLLFGGVGAGGNVLGDTEILTAKPPAMSGLVPSGSVPGSPGSPPVTSTTSPLGPAPVTDGGAQQGTVPGDGGRGGHRMAPLHASARHARRGELMTLSGSGFRAGTTITITFHSRPFLVGRTRADGAGRFTATVAVPTAASMGRHHFEAAGLSPSGAMLVLVTPIDVVGAGGPSTGVVQAVVLVLLAIALPCGTWLAMAIPGRRRPRSESA